MSSVGAHSPGEVTMRTGLAAVFVLAAVAHSCLAASSAEKLEDACKKAGEKFGAVIGKKVIGVSPDRLIRAYKSNAVDADDYYKDEILCVSGTVRKIDKDLGGSAVVILEPFDDRLWPGEVRGVYKPGYESMLKGIRPGEITAVVGVCAGGGLFDIVTIEECGPPEAEYAKKIEAFEKKKATEAAARQEQYQKDKEAAHRKLLEYQAEEKRKKRPAAAAGKLKLAKSLKAAGKEEGYRKWLKQIVEQYPETDSAEEARKLLEGE